MDRPNQNLAYFRTRMDFHLPMKVQTTQNNPILTGNINRQY